MILLLDNYDSFTWNLYHFMEQVSDEQVVVIRNDQLVATDASIFSSIIFSPGPGLPSESGVMAEIIRLYHATIPMLGICLGHQALAESVGAKLENLDHVQHGKQRRMIVTDPHDRLMKGLNEPFTAGLYHSWIVSKESLPSELKITATDEAGRIMALSHERFPFSGVQFHPESIMTNGGKTLLANWIEFCHHHQREIISPIT